MKVLILVLLLTSFACAFALSEGEKTAIYDLVEEWPALRAQSPPWTTNASAACDHPPFYGVKCSSGPDTHVLSMNFDLQTEEGSIPESIEGLLWLQNLTLKVSLIQGELPATIGNLVNLGTLSFTMSQAWSFKIPESIGNLENLKVLSLSLESYQQKLPDGISKLKSLESLILTSQNSIDSFGGPMPSSICNLDNLRELKLRSNMMSGFDACVGRLPNLVVLHLAMLEKMRIPLQSVTLGRFNLTTLYLHNTPVFGSLDFRDQRNLVELTISGTDVSGDLHPSIWTNTQLVVLDLSDSSVTGTISSDISQLQNLRSLSLGSTQVGGTIPAELGLCKSLERIDSGRTKLRGALPPEIGDLPLLSYLDLSRSSIGGTIPDSFSKLQKLSHIKIDGCSIEGQIPPSIFQLPCLVTFIAYSNRLNGTIPDISSTVKVLSLQKNELVGAIPDSVLSVPDVYLSRNRLSGQLKTIFSTTSHLDLSHNLLEGHLPTIMPNRPQPPSITLAYNRFTGTIPDHYRMVNFYWLDISSNLLQGSIAPLLENKFLTGARLDSNSFSGPIPLSIPDNIFVLDVSQNLLTGTVPKLSKGLSYFKAANNNLHGTLDQLFSDPRVKEGKLRNLDLSHNRLEGTLPELFLLTSFISLSLSSNNFSGSIEYLTDCSKNVIESLDLSNNRLTGIFPSEHLPSTLNSLIISNNALSGDFALPKLAMIVDISNNEFDFDISAIDSQPTLSYFYAQNNKIYGSLLSSGYSSLRLADFSSNKISEVDFETIAKLSTNNGLKSLSIANNSVQLYNLGQLVASKALMITSTMIPSVKYPGVICNRITFGQDSNNQFDYDESLLSYQQCQCDREFYGVPPSNCFDCIGTTSSPSTCGGYNLSIAANHFLFETETQGNRPLEVENCIPEAYRVLGTSNCIGLNVWFDRSGSHVLNGLNEEILEGTPTRSILLSPSQLRQQCRTGSSGRLCSKCDCDISSGACFYPGAGNLCTKCKKIAPLNVVVMVSITIVIVVMIALTVVFYFILVSKNSLHNTKWNRLSIGKRVLYRLIYLTSLGQITIMVTFVQILVEITDWDAYALNSWLQLLNGKSEGLGLRCFFTFLSDPTYLLVMRLSAPFLAIGIVCTSVGIAGFVHHSVASFRVSRSENASNIDEQIENEDGQSEELLTSEKIQTPIKKYPIVALASSTSISLAKFFYFGTTLAAFEYLFSSKQSQTNKEYVQSVPWMLYSDARTLRTISIPFIVVFLLGIPTLFLVLSWRIRHKVLSPFVRLYFGSIFENYQPSLFWWEIINVLKKLSVAIFLRWLSPNDALQPFLTSFIIAFLGLVIMKFKPWKLDHENFLEGLGSVLLIFSLASSRSGHLLHHVAVTRILVTLDSIYVVACIAIIVFRTLRDETPYEKEWKFRFGSLQPHDDLTDYGPPPLAPIEMRPTLSEINGEPCLEDSARQ